MKGSTRVASSESSPCLARRERALLGVCLGPRKLRDEASDAVLKLAWMIDLRRVPEVRDRLHRGVRR